MFIELRKFIKDMVTSPDGEHYDVHAVVGFGVVILGALLFFAGYIWSMKTGKAFDGSNFATGLVGISGAIVSVQAGMWIRSKSNANDAKSAADTAEASAPPEPVAPSGPADMRHGTWYYVEEIGWAPQGATTVPDRSKYWRLVEGKLIPPNLSVDEMARMDLNHLSLYRPRKRTTKLPPSVPPPGSPGQSS